MYDAIRRMQEQQEMIRRLAEGPAAEFLRNQHALTRALETDSIAALATRLTVPDSLRRIAEAGSMLSDVMERFRTPSFIRAVEDAARTQEQLGATVRGLLASHESAVGQLVAMSDRINAVMQIMPTIDFHRIGALAGAADTHRALISRVTENLYLRHTDLIETFADNPGLIGGLPPAVADLPAMDLFVHTIAVRAFTPHEPMGEEDERRAGPMRVTIVTETEHFLEDTLPRLKPAFLIQYRGLKARVITPGPDGWTQGGASMRRLLKGVLHTVAPNEAVLPWAEANGKELDRLGRPTRATKADWLCRHIDSDEYRLYMRAELHAALALINLLDASQHEDELTEFADGYELIVSRVELAVRHMLTLWLTALRN